jgi:hypothetical protein
MIKSDVASIEAGFLEPDNIAVKKICIMIKSDVAPIVVGFLDPDDIRKLAMTCKQIHTDDSVKKICIDKCTRRLYPVDGRDYQIHTHNGFQLPRVYRIYSRLDCRSAYLLLGTPEVDEINSRFFHIHYENVLYSFFMPPEPFTEENGHASEVPVRSLAEREFLGTVVGISFRELENTANRMSIVLVVNRAHSSTLTLRIESRFTD